MIGQFRKKMIVIPLCLIMLFAVLLSTLELNTFAANAAVEQMFLEDLAIQETQNSNFSQLGGPDLLFFEENFDDSTRFGSTGGVIIPEPWIQEGSNNSTARTSASNYAPSVPNMVKIDVTDALALPLNTTGYDNIKVSYSTRASSYSAGSMIVEWSADGGSNWTTLEEFKLPAGTTSSPNTEKTWNLGNQANNNPNFKVRFRVGNPISGNIYFDSVAISGQAIPGITPVIPPISPPTDLPEGKSCTDFPSTILYEDVEIGTAGNRPIYMSIAVPETPPADPMPVVVYVHGGGWNHGDRKGDNNATLRNICGMVSKRGYIGVTVDYRLTGEAIYPAQIQDVKLAIRYLRAHRGMYKLDPSRIGVWGVSAGGHLASLLGTTGDLMQGELIELDNGNIVETLDLEGTGGWQEYSSKVQAVIDWYGPADFITPEANKDRSLTALLGGPAGTLPNLARLAMPGTYASSDDPPFWIRHGKDDKRVPYTQSEKFAQQLRNGGVQVVDLKIVPKQGHGFTGEAKTQADREAWAFLDQHVKNKVVTNPIIYKPGYNPNQQ
ncbi:alpha/beta hydrolase [Caldalkalibacillus mannanilyticus]|uniref:alpha/beta hydrolase n=1 Tax=Caldalkalibacillus mannanilyticus TaxID=1418 RepID=UPI000469395F|nr:alpha/beta hydrolase [Caldalkalibacillus mannanilyticus]